jgi:hypothetical protein
VAPKKSTVFGRLAVDKARAAPVHERLQKRTNKLSVIVSEACGISDPSISRRKRAWDGVTTGTEALEAA